MTWRTICRAGRIAVLAVVAGATAVWGCGSGGADGVDVAKPGDSLFKMSFSATTLDGSQFSTLGGTGRVVLINVFATWCPGCQSETPELVSLYQQYHAQGLDVAMVTREKASVAEAFRDRYRIPFPMVVGAEGASVQDMVPALVYIPTTVILDRSGNVRYRITGYHPEEMRDAITKLLAEK